MPLKKSLIQILRQITKIALGALFVTYPFIIFFALQRGVALRALALELVAYAALSFCRHRNKTLLVLGALLSLLLLCFDNGIFLRLYPVLMNMAVCGLFFSSMSSTPLITTIARRMGTTMTPRAIRYTRCATIAWGIFMLLNTLISFTTLFTSLETWTLYNGLISYILIAMMMLAEYIIRTRFMRNDTNK